MINLGKHVPRNTNRRRWSSSKWSPVGQKIDLRGPASDWRPAPANLDFITRR